ncbi:MAG: hypothetical protein QNI87_06280 [Erythrobacter sp.]|uniref:hypothetical protein n=1 Tax=Erythrobacter sp. TaxID=1042 RepID=UPI002616D83C|nr:hypothetical protein [Erythrobacter sp.]MDJ0978123.1 hypothetical protein [Erythrobacter sp.]
MSMGLSVWRRPITLADLQFLVFVLVSLSMFSVAWLVSHARDVVLVLRHILPLDPGEGKRLTSPRSVCIALTVFGFTVAAEIWVALRAQTYLTA